MPVTKFIMLEGKIQDIHSLHFLRAEWQHERSRFILIRYAKDGQEQPLGLRMDLDKKVLLDTVADPRLDTSVQELASTIWSVVATERAEGKIYQKPLSAPDEQTDVTESGSGVPRSCAR
jgi:hypothetical protein